MMTCIMSDKFRVSKPLSNRPMVASTACKASSVWAPQRHVRESGELHEFNRTWMFVPRPNRHDITYSVIIWPILVSVLVNGWNIHTDSLWSFFIRKIKPVQHLIYFLIACHIITIGYLVRWTFSFEQTTAARPHRNSWSYILKFGSDPYLAKDTMVMRMKRFHGLFFSLLRLPVHLPTIWTSNCFRFYNWTSRWSLDRRRHCLQFHAFLDTSLLLNSSDLER